MLSGKLFRLNRETISVQAQGEHRHLVMVPEGAVITVLPGSEDRRTVDVLWEGQALEMFAEDIRKRGKEVSARATHA